MIFAQVKTVYLSVVYLLINAQIKDMRPEAVEIVMD